jgi:hypothetical protein
MGTVIQFKTRLPPIIREQLYELVIQFKTMLYSGRTMTKQFGGGLLINGLL